MITNNIKTRLPFFNNIVVLSLLLLLLTPLSSLATPVSLRQRAENLPGLDLGTSKSASQYHVRNLPGSENLEGQMPTMHAGHITINETHNSKLFFWSFDAEDPLPGKQKTVSYFLI